MAIPGVNFFWNVMTLKAKVVAIGLFLLLILVAVGGYKACKWLNPPPKLDEKAIQKAQDAITKKDREAMKQILVESDVAEKKIDANVANASADTVTAYAEARKKANEMSNEELAAELERRANQ